MGFNFDYLRAYERLPGNLTRCFKVLLREREAILMSMRAFFIRTVDGRDDLLFDVDSFWKFSSSCRSSVFTEYDAFVIDVLGCTPDFFEKFEKEMGRYALNAGAMVDAFLNEVFKDRPGPDGPLANRYYRSFVAWLKGKRSTGLSRPILYVAHKVKSDSWLTDHELEHVESSGESYKMLFSSFLIFLRDWCHTSLDRQVALFMENHLFERTSLIPVKDVVAELRRYRYDSNLSERDLRNHLDLVRRRFISFLLCEGFHQRLPASFYARRTVKEWEQDFMNIAKVDDLSRAKALLEMGPDLIEPALVSSDESLRGLANHFQELGIKSKMSRRDGRKVLELLHSFCLVENSNRTVTVVWPDGRFVDMVTGKTGNIKGYL